VSVIAGAVLDPVVVLVFPMERAPVYDAADTATLLNAPKLTVIALEPFAVAFVTHQISSRHDVPLLMAMDLAEVYEFPTLSVMLVTVEVVVRMLTLTTMTSFCRQLNPARMTCVTLPGALTEPELCVIAIRVDQTNYRSRGRGKTDPLW
jgi:hypothetical protein